MWLELTTINGRKTYVKATDIINITPMVGPAEGCYLNMSSAEFVQVKESAESVLQMLEANTYYIMHPYARDEEILQGVNHLRNSKEKVFICLALTKHRKD